MNSVITPNVLVTVAWQRRISSSQRLALNDRVNTTLSLGYYILDYAPAARGGLLTARSDDYVSVRASVDVKITRHLDGQVFYQFRSRLSKTSGDILNSQTGVQLSWGL